MSKLAVKPEGRTGVWLVEKADLKKFIKARKLESIHCFLQAGPGMLVGADWAPEAVFKSIDAAERIAVLTGGAKKVNMQHALAVIVDNKLEAFDIGELVEKDLNID